MPALFEPSNSGEVSVKSVLLAVFLSAAAVMFMPSEASAWVCTANSPSAWGKGWHNYSLGYARRRALAECAARTPRWQTCYITSCY
jgi:hypothetical protein